MAFWSEKRRKRESQLTSENTSNTGVKHVY